MLARPLWAAAGAATKAPDTRRAAINELRTMLDILASGSLSGA
jgi:hypothetical protein